MPKYKYTAINEKGETVKNLIVADDRNQFDLIIKSRKEYLIKLKILDETNKFDKSIKISKKGLFVMCRQFSAMLSSGVNTVKCLEILYNQTENKKVKIALYEVYEQLQTGKNLSEAMGSLDGVFSEFMINMIKAGEISGSLEDAIKRLATQYEKDIKIKNKIISAMVYPIFLLIASIISILVMFGAVLPKIMEVIGSPEDLNFFSRTLFNTTNYLKENWIVVLISTLICMVIFALYSQTEKFKYDFSKFKVKAPIIGKLYIMMVAGIFTRTLSTLFLSGATLTDSVEMAGKVLNNRYISEKLNEVVADMTNGIIFSDALIKAEIFPYSIVSMISVGEETGTIEEILRETSDYYDMIAEDAIQKMTAIIEPIMIILFGMIVLIILVGAFVPIYSMYNNIGAI